MEEIWRPIKDYEGLYDVSKAISCHYDIIDWLEPDWIFCTDTMKFEICKKKDQKLDVQYTNVKEMCGRFLENIII